MKTWTQKEVEILIANYNIATNERLSEMIPNKTPIAIYKKAYKMGLRKTPEIEFLNRSVVRRREKAASWKGGTKVSRRGYRLVLCPEHPRADANGYVLEHILVWERETGVPVPQNCCVHHLNGNKTDNRIQNLCVMLHSAHTALHHTGAKRTDETKTKISESRRKNYA